MPTTINLHIEGLALCFLKPDRPGLESVWNVVFVCDDAHPLGLVHPDGNEPQLRVIGRDVELDFISNDIVPNLAAFDSSGGQMLNISSSDMHDCNGLGRSNLRIRDDRAERRNSGLIDNDLVWMRVPNAALMTEAINSKTYWVQEIDVDGNDIGNQIKKGHLAKKLLITFEVESDLTLRVADAKGPTLEKKFAVTSDIASHDFELNNDCRGNCDHNDILGLYDFVTDDSRGKERRFLSGKSPRGSHAYKRDIALQIRSAQGNCDPVGTDPPPQP